MEGIFMTFDKNKNHTLEYQEITQALTAAGIKVDDFVPQLISLRYTEPDLTINFPGFLFLGPVSERRFSENSEYIDPEMRVFRFRM
ncbi:hypothetical protein IRJ41_013624 [Triplophysa rosa]|uniref:EF-hand domain-containing protein n=1 Tax=Triplophysa rosa TaxID=992332 RepID=A0A9W7W968_TRIRA|nr:hypothetical protein IRJ41_013624 [Triplophysa rosa]